MVADGEPGQAALGTLLAARIYGGTVIREGVEDRDDNETRFVWLARATRRRAAPRRRCERARRRSGRRRCVFWGAGAERPGWLVRCLDEFAAQGDQPDEDRVAAAAGAAGQLHVLRRPRRRAARTRRSPRRSRGVRAMCEEVRVLGSYRAAASAGRVTAASRLRQRRARERPR